MAWGYLTVNDVEYPNGIGYLAVNAVEYPIAYDIYQLMLLNIRWHVIFNS